MIAPQDKTASAAVQTHAPAFADLVAAEIAAHQAHDAACTTYGKIEGRVLAKEIPADDPGYLAAQEAEGLACDASMEAWAELIEAPVPDLQGAHAQLQSLVRNGIIDVTEPDRPVRGHPYDTDEALRRVIRNLLQFAPPQGEPPAPSRFTVWAAERDRLMSQSAGLPNATDQSEIDRLDAASFAYDQLIRNAPCTDLAAALGKLEWLRMAFTIGETGDEERVLDQIVGFLQGQPAPDIDPAQDRALSDRAACDVAALIPALQASLVEETTAEELGLAEAAALHSEARDEMENIIADLKASSVEGAVLQLMLATDRVEMIYGCTHQEDREHHHDKFEALMGSALAVLGNGIPEDLWRAYIGGVAPSASKPRLKLEAVA